MNPSSQNSLDLEAVLSHQIGGGLSPPQHNFVQALNHVGIRFQGTIIADGRIHRFQTHKPGRRDGWYFFYGMAGAFGDWSRDIHERWSVLRESLSHQEREGLNQQIERSQRAAQEQRDHREEEAATYALKKWNQCTDSGHSAYLEKKKVKAFDTRFNHGYLVVPLRDIMGKLWSLQWINPEGSKRFLRGGRKRGCFHAMGDLQEGRVI